MVDNVLIDVNGDGTFNCAICDFGFANFTKESGKQFVSGLEKDNALGISPRYAAPEVIYTRQRKGKESHIICVDDHGNED